MRKKVLASGVLLIMMIMNQDCICQTKIVALIEELKESESFLAVNSIKEKLVNQGSDAIPFLIEVLKDTAFVKLTETGNLIYPGSTKFSSHGYIINYAIDWRSVRAGWILEELTFEDFGYRKNGVTESELFFLAESVYSPEYVQSGSYTFDFLHVTEEQRIKEYRKLLAVQVENWWRTQQNSWNRFIGLKSALFSKNTDRIHRALDYIRVGTTKCDYLTRESFTEELKPIVKRIRLTGKNGTSDHARMILKDKRFEWLDRKNMDNKEV